MRNSSAGLRLEMRNSELTTELCAERFSSVLRRWTGSMRNAAKRVGRSIGTDPRAVENYIYGRTCPPAAKLIELMAECEDLADEVNRLVEEVRESRRVNVNTGTIPKRPVYRPSDGSGGARAHVQAVSPGNRTAA
jgi:hypothetical protein